jgi:hypothetical protein
MSLKEGRIEARSRRTRKSLEIAIHPERQEEGQTGAGKAMAALKPWDVSWPSSWIRRSGRLRKAS